MGNECLMFLSENANFTLWLFVILSTLQRCLKVVTSNQYFSSIYQQDSEEIISKHA